MTLRGPTIAADFKAIIERYVAERYGAIRTQAPVA
jgi:hypothetical protein